MRACTLSNPIVIEKKRFCLSAGFFATVLDRIAEHNASIFKMTQPDCLQKLAGGLFLFLDRRMFMLQVKKLTMHHMKDLKAIIKDLSFTVNPGDKVALIGEEGNGKSTLLKWINRDLSIDSYIQAEGTLVNHFSKTIYLPQALPADKHNLTLDAFFFGVEDALEMDYQLLYQTVTKMGFDPDRLTSSQLLRDLSGGEKVKIQLLKILAQNPDLLLLDEPSNDLDLQTVQWLEDFIKMSPLTILFISHDESLLKATATKVIQLELLRHKTIPVATVSSLSYEEYQNEKENKFETQTRIASKQREEYQKQMARHQRIESSVHDAQKSVSRQEPGVARLLKKKMHTVKAMGKRFEREKDNFEDIPIKEDAILMKFINTKELPDGKTIIHLDQTSVSFEGKTLVTHLSLHLKGKQKVGIIGQNGIGKSTWLKQLWEEMRDRKDIYTGYMPQNYLDILPAEETPLTFLNESGDWEEKTKVMTYLGSMRYTHEEMTHPIKALSGGQQAKLLLIKIDLTGQNVLLLDEPTRNFSPLSQRELRTLLRSFPGAILTISHDRTFLREVCEVVYEMTATGLKEIQI